MASNLIIIHVPGRQEVSDFVAVKKKMAVRAPDIAVYIVTADTPVPHGFWNKMAELPTVIFSPMPVAIPPPVRGARLIVKPTPKFKEFQLLANAGFAVPRTQAITAEAVFEELVWGPFLVIKPDKGYGGAGVRLVRTRDVKSAVADTGKQFIAQEFVNTGPFISCHRVFTVLGRVVYSITSTALERLPSLDVSGSDPISIPVAANGVARRIELCRDRDIIDLGEAVYRKLNHTPVMGIDIIRHHDSGRLYVLELNSGGMTWHLSSELGRHQQQERGLDYYKQFGALDIITDALIEATRKHAR
jgi:hypothetical protein